MKTEKESTKNAWIEKVLNSADHLTPLPVSSALTERLISIPNKIKTLSSELYVTRQRIWLAAASIALLIATSITVFQYKNSPNNDSGADIYDNYFSYLNQL